MTDHKIYNEYLNGKSVTTIAKELEHDKILKRDATFKKITVFDDERISVEFLIELRYIKCKPGAYPFCFPVFYYGIN